MSLIRALPLRTMPCCRRPGRSCSPGGYRPASAESHMNTFAFLASALGSEHADLVSYFDRMRNKRNRTVYGVADRIAETEARNLLTKATGFVRLVRRLAKETP